MMTRARLRDLGISVGLLPPGPANAITDVPGVTVGHTTLIAGSGPHVPGQGPIRTGVTAIVPHGGNCFEQRVPAAIHVLNGAGEMTGRSQVDSPEPFDSWRAVRDSAINPLFAATVEATEEAVLNALTCRQRQKRSI